MATGELISHWMWNGPDPSASSYAAAATALQGVATHIGSILSAQQANAGALAEAWPSPTGAKAIMANSPYHMWLTEAQNQIQIAGYQIVDAAAGFLNAQQLTPNPAAFHLINVTFAHLLLGLPWTMHAIAANRATHTAMTIAAQTAYAAYTTVSQGTVGTITPLSAPPSSAVPGAISAGSAALPASGLSSVGSGASSVGSSVGSGASSVGSSVGSGVSQLMTQPGGALASSGSELAQGPSAASGLSSVASPMSSAPLTSGLGSSPAGSSGAGAHDGNWAMSAEGGTVAAALSGGGAGGGAGLGGFGGAGAMTATRVIGPGPWGSVTAATPEANQAGFSRIAATSAASAMPATSGGMGAPGAMSPAARQGSESERQRGLNDPLAAAAVLYRPPKDMPVVTGAAGVQFVAGREGQ